MMARSVFMLNLSFINEKLKKALYDSAKVYDCIHDAMSDNRFF